MMSSKKRPCIVELTGTLGPVVLMVRMAADGAEASGAASSGLENTRQVKPEKATKRFTVETALFEMGRGFGETTIKRVDYRIIK